MPYVWIVCFMVCLAAVIHPFPPFRSRGRALVGSVVFLVLFVFSVPPSTTDQPQQPTSSSGNAAESAIQRDWERGTFKRATISEGLSNADLAWHALNTYGWDCSAVTSRGEMQGDFFYITCANGVRLRVYPRSGQHPRITNERGGYN